MAPPEPPLLTLNVGGRLFTALRATLRSRPGSLLSAMFSGEWEPTAVLDEGGHPYIDRDPDLFPAILSFMRDGTAPVPTDAEKRQALRAEASYFGCWPLVEAIDAGEELYARMEAAREQRLLAEACLTHELAELVRTANSELEAAAAAVDAARAEMVALNADMKAATAEAQAANRELQGGAAVVPPAERVRQRRRLHAAAVRWHALQDQYEEATRAHDAARRRQRAAQAAKLAAIQVAVPPQPDDSDDEDEERLPRHLHPEEPIGWLAPPADFEEWEEAEAQREARQAADAAAAAEGAARRAADPFRRMGGGFAFAGGWDVGDLFAPVDFGAGVRPRPAADPGAGPAVAPDAGPAPAAAPVAPVMEGGAAPPPVAFGFGGAFNFRERLLRNPFDGAAGLAPALAAQAAAPAPPAAAAAANPFRAGANAAGAAQPGEEGAPALLRNGAPANAQRRDDAVPAPAAGGPAARPAAAAAPAQPLFDDLFPAPNAEPAGGRADAEAPAPGEEGAAPPAAAEAAAIPAIAMAPAAEEVPAPAASPPGRQGRSRRGRAGPRAAVHNVEEEQQEQEQEQVPANRPATRGRGARPPAADKQEQGPAGRARRRGRAEAA